MSKRLLCAFLILSLLAGLTGCKKKNEAGNFTLYFRDQTKASLVQVKAEVDVSGKMERVISSIWSRMCDSSEGSGYISAIPTGLTLKSFSLDENDLILNFGKEYPQVNTPEEVLLRAALVKTFSQLDVVSSVEFYVDSQMLADAEGQVLGPQKRMHFVDVMEQGLNDYSFAPVVLYYANDTGDGLVAVKEEIAYKSDFPLAQRVVVRLIIGTDVAGANAVLPRDTKIISVTTRDGVCYVNLNNAIEQAEVTVVPEIVVYSIVNSLTELSGISAVSISINGRSGMFLDTIDLSKPLTRNLDYVDNSSLPAEE